MLILVDLSTIGGEESMNRKQRLFFTAEMCLGMGTIMGLTGNLMATGFTSNALTSFWIWWGPTVLFAFIYNVCIASKITNFLITHATKSMISQVKIERRSARIRSCSMIIVMCLSMSSFGMLIGGGISHISMGSLLTVWARSLFLAYIIRGIVVKPLAEKGLQLLKV